MRKLEPTQGERRIARVAGRAREESPPAIDVSRAVVQRLRDVQAVYAPERPMLWMTAGAIAAAAVVMTLSMPYLSAALDPLTLFLQEAATSAI